MQKYIRSRCRRNTTPFLLILALMLRKILLSTWWWLGLLLLMAASSLWSRALLSYFTMLFLASCLLQMKDRSPLRQLFTSPFAWSMWLLFLIPAFSGIWSDNTANWLRLILIKLPYLFMPLAFFAMPVLKQRDWNIFSGLVVLLLCIACGWSVWQYLQSPLSIQQLYLAAKTLPVWMGDDHLRFSWLLVVVMIAAIHLFHHAHTKWLQWTALAAAMFFFLFMHLLAARTGLLLSYLFFAGYLIWQLRNRFKQYNAVLLLLILAITTLAWAFLPTLQNRFSYLRYTYTQTNTAYVAGSVDGNRLLSLKAGWHILQHHPFGIGLGDVQLAVNAWYEERYPKMLAEDKLFPSNEWLIHGCVAGWPGVILFSIAIFFPLLSNAVRHNFFLFILIVFNLLIAFTDSSLEGQFGVFIHTFTLLWWWQWVQSKKDNFAA